MYPIAILSILGIVVLYLGFAKSKSILLPATLLSLLLAFIGNFIEWNDGPLLYFYGMLEVSKLTMLFNAIVLFAAFWVVSLSRGFQDDPEAQPAEYYAIMLFALVGAFMMIAYEHLIMLFLGVETLTVAMYILTASDKRNLRSNEAALKYFLMGAFMTGIMLFGITLLYGATGSFTITQIMSYSTQGLRATQFLLYAGMFLLLIGMLFKVSAAPFHFWTPDVYDGAPTIFTSFMSTVVKVAGFAAVYRLLSHAFVAMQDVWWVTLAAMTVLTLLAGNITAVYQNSFKRMLAYSSISHAGYLMIALTALTATTQQAVLFYSLAYVAATVAAFGVLLLIAKEKSPEERFNESFDAFNGLAKNNPLLAFVLTVSMLSLAGIPLTAGFWGKFFVFSSAVERGGLTWLLVVAVLMSTVGIYYYLRVVIAAYFREGNTPTLRIAPFYKVALLLATATTILLGIMPGLVEQLW